MTSTMLLVLERPSKFIFRFVWKCTVPEVRAKSVWSEPTPMFLPGSIFVPRCRTTISPIPTFCPSERFTPRYLGFESFRLCAVPPAFVWAIELNAVYRIRYTVYRITTHKHAHTTRTCLKNQAFYRNNNRGVGNDSYHIIYRIWLIWARTTVDVRECSTASFNY